MKVIGVQLDIVWENKAANFEKTHALLEHANIENNSLIVLPEMFATGFSMHVESIGESKSGETETFLRSLAIDYRSYIVGGLTIRSPDGLGRNEAVVCDPSGKVIARYCKLHPFTFGGETKYYESGESLITFQWGDFTVAPFICYDLRFPEVFRWAVLRTADLFIVIANWPQARESHWITLLTARAIENQAYMVGVNRCGTDPKLSYSGRSLILDPRGKQIADAGIHERLIEAELDHSSLLTYRSEFPALSDIRSRYMSWES